MTTKKGVRGPKKRYKVNPEAWTAWEGLAWESPAWGSLGTFKGRTL
jgi:hypothetical protein